MLWVNGETAANSGARNPLPLPGMGCLPDTQLLAGPQDKPQAAPQVCCWQSDSQTMGDVQKVSGIQ